MKNSSIILSLLAGASALALTGAAIASASTAETLTEATAPTGKVYRTLEGSSLVVPVKALRSIEAEYGWKVVLTQGRKNEVRLEYDERIAEYLSVTYEEGKLELGSSKSKGIRFKDLGNPKKVAFITVTDLREIDLSGAASLEVKNTIVSRGKFSLDLSGASSADNFLLKCRETDIDLSGASRLVLSVKGTNMLEAEISGASRMTLEGSPRRMVVDCSGAGKFEAGKLDLSDLRLELSGASKAEMSGTAAALEAEITGASNLSAQELIVQECRIELSGASRGTLTVKKSLFADLNGSSSLNVYGNPSKVTKDIDRGSDLNIK